MEYEQLRLGSDLVDVMRAGVTIAAERGARFVAPPHLLLALLADERIGTAIGSLVPRARIERAADDAVKKLPEVYEILEGPLPERERAPFQRYDTLAFRSRDGARTMYLDADAYHLFLEGALRAGATYRAKHLVMGFSAESVKDRDLLAIVGPDPAGLAAAVAEL